MTPNSLSLCHFGAPSGEEGKGFLSAEIYDVEWEELDVLSGYFADGQCTIDDP